MHYNVMGVYATIIDWVRNIKIDAVWYLSVI